MNEISTNDNALYVVRIEGGPELGERIQAESELLETSVVVWEDEDSPRVVVEEYFDSRSEAESRLAEWSARESRWSGGEAWKKDVVVLPQEDWQNAWKKHFHTTRISERIVIKPSWEAYEAGPGDCVIELDPGMSFGTGLHATTRACLKFVDRLTAGKPGGSFLDLGCGSGVLSIAAAQLGCSSVMAIDMDPLAVRISVENAGLNGVADKIIGSATDLADFNPGQTFDLVAANLTADILEKFREKIAGFVSGQAGGSLLLAGILTTQYPCVKALFEDLGFRETDRYAEKEWTSGCFQF